ncbi:MAG: hypothetical protein Q4G03_08695 [Planctomycetia bacterium]|nr:hypothetical protein [Planctomycetia bacterium]
MNRREVILGALGVLGATAGAANVAMADESQLDSALAVLKSLSTQRQALGFLDEPVTKCDDIVSFGLSTLSHGNKQPWFISVVKNRELLKKIDEEAGIDSAKRLSFAGAPLAIIISVAEDDSDYQHLAVGCLLERMIIAANLLGYGVKTVKAGLSNVNESDLLKESLKIPEGFDAYVALLIGKEKEQIFDGASNATSRAVNKDKIAEID